MKSGTHLRTGAGVLFALLAIAAQSSAWGQSFTTFDPPGSQGTAPGSINAAGQIAGTYFESDFSSHGFVRNPDGTINSFDVPGFLATVIITQQGVVVGMYFDANGSHLFERAPNGTITTLEIPSPGASVYAIVVNTSGAMAGGFFDANGGVNGFIRNPGGKFTLFPMPSSLSPSFFIPNITALTQTGTIVGSYVDQFFNNHGYLLSPNGNLTFFDVPNATSTSPTSVNDSGNIAGFFYDGSENGKYRVFLRSTSGTFATFDTPQPGSFFGLAAINPSSAVAGSAFNSSCNDVSCTTTVVSFQRGVNRIIKPVNDPLAVQGTQSAQGTAVLGITPSGEMFGAYFDANGMQHGFVAKP